MHTRSLLSQWYELIDDHNTKRLVLTGDYTLTTLRKVLSDLTAELTQHQVNYANLEWDLTNIQQMDSVGISLLWRIWQAQRPKFIHLRPEQEQMLVRLEQLTPPIDRKKSIDVLSPIVNLGNVAAQFWRMIIGLIALVGQLFLDMLYLIRHPANIPWREISANIYRAGAQALGITALVGFLIGVVISYLASKQLQLFGADIFIVNLLGMSIIRELGPMLAAILVAGRSGSAMTAQLGVMRVTQELDALSVMGISHSQRLILPKILGLGIAMPLLVAWTSAMALIGGIVAAEIQLGLSYQYFLSALPDSVPIANLWLGLSKGVVCGMTIGLIACYFGLKIKPNTESLGIGTTSSVVTAITIVIIIDAIFAIMFSHIGIR
ncbi:phospholipid/cholesterol/gamma-HCH transport system permease protein [Nitrosomonas sp. PY1]|uniref:ABC transporter permease n=1 Tax=Nitrosomonas sp. PY1 TaxID=1803906 RepID=UPI001FC8C059|nr:ABC transporter permease [Nitrosomonas sp. PY1]GKS69023.1 phospholipid/cholesterol/gamma-HCH transport system permease protein [Nitrosomonas sp. PY1]